MKKNIFFFFFLFSVSVSGQMSPSWINHFCCFDSVGPHSFSYPLGVVVENDSIIVGYFEDDSMKVKIISSNTGADLSNFDFTNDTVFSPVYYGGSFVKCREGYVSVTSTTDANGSSFLIFNVIDHNFNLINSTRLGTAYLQNKMTGLFNYPGSDTSYYVAQLSDSLRIFNFNTTDYSARVFSYGKDRMDRLYRNLFFNSSGDLTVVGFEPDGSHSSLVFKRIEVLNGNLLQSKDSTLSLGYSHECLQKDDSLIVVFTPLLPWPDLTFMSVDMNSFEYSDLIYTGEVVTGYFYRNLCKSPTLDKYYVETEEELFQFGTDYSFEYVRVLGQSTVGIYNQSPVLFDQNENPILFNSYLNNTILNEDLICRRLDRNSGNTIDSLIYDDVRNTPDFAVAQFFDAGNNLNLLYANDFDDAFILQEEAQLNIIQLSSLTNSQDEIPLEVIVIYPNPVSNYMKLSNKNLAGCRVDLCDVTGKSLKKFILNPESEIDVSDLKTGLYFLQFKKEGIVISNAKFIKIEN
ncbi:MAG: T9SS type A sorting domain-containing protein [Bacteroidetes bacterium]|nr:T9SS type A sorting domain-containing protein [Bacteroidota bacterium]